MSRVIQFLTVLILGFCITLTVSAQELNLTPDCSQAKAIPDTLLSDDDDEFVAIQISGVTDPNSHAITLSTQCIVQDEPLNSEDDGDDGDDGDGDDDEEAEMDGAGLFSDQPMVRAEYSEDGDGRVYHIVFKATDSEGANCSGQVAVSVPNDDDGPLAAIDSGSRYPSVPGGENCDAQPINNPPVIYSAPILGARVGSQYRYDAAGHDPDQDTLSYSLVNPPEGMVIAPQNGLIQWTPAPAQEGTHTILVKVTDPGNLTATQSFEVFVEADPDRLSAQIIANPESGTSPLTVRFSPDVQNNNIVITGYQWDFDGNGTVDISDLFGAPKTYIYTGSPGDTFEAKLTVTPASGDPLVATKTITIDNRPPVVQVTTNATNGHAPLQVVFSVTASDPQGIGEVSIDYEGDGIFDDTQSGNGLASGSWSFQTAYQSEGTYLATVKVTDTFGAATLVANNAITVDVNNPLDPVIELSADPLSGGVPLAVAFTANATLYDGSLISQWHWDLDGDGYFEAQGGSNETDSANTTYHAVGYYYPSVKVTTGSGRTAIASLRIETQSTAQPTVSIPDSSDTINSDASQTAAINVTLPYETELALWIEDANGVRVKTIQPGQTAGGGSYAFTWDGTNDQNAVVPEGDYYAVLGYSAYGVAEEIDLRATTGGQLSYYRRTTSNPRTFDRLEEPLRIDYAVDDPAEVTFFWQISFGARLMTLLEHERMGRGQYSLYWNGEYPSGQKVPDSLNTLMPGIVRYSLPDNVIFVKENPRIEDYRLKSTIIADPRREPIGLDITLSKPGTIELVVSDMEKGVDVATRIYSGLSAGAHNLTWDGKNNSDQYLAPNDYRIGVRSVDSNGNRSLFWYRTQRIEY